MYHVLQAGSLLDTVRISDRVKIWADSWRKIRGFYEKIDQSSGNCKRKDLAVGGALVSE